MTFPDLMPHVVRYTLVPHQGDCIAVALTQTARARLKECDLTEQSLPEAMIASGEGLLNLACRPFEIKTVRWS